MLPNIKKTLKSWSELLIGNIETHSLEHRTARVACFVATSVSIIRLGVNLSISHTGPVIAGNIVITIFFLSIYLYIVKTGKSNEVYWPIVIFTNAFFAISYIGDEGAKGSAMYYYLFLVMFVTMAGGDKKKYMLILVLSTISILYVIEWYYPHIILYRATKIDSFINLYSSVILCALFGYTWVSAILANYFYQREKAIRQKTEIEKQKELIEDLSARERKINDMRLNFFTNLSHEFRTPLSLIFVTLEKLKELESEKTTASPTDKMKHYDIIYKYAHKLNHMVDEALEFRKLDAGQAQINISENDIVNFIEDVTNSFLSLAETKTITLTFRSNTESFLLKYDSIMIEKVMYNLLSNAMKFTPPQGTVHVDLMVVPEGVFIKIEDTGIGISKEYLSQVFKPFYQTPGAKQGTGIGLSLAFEYIKMHNGTISVTSEPGQGSCFTIQLPDQQFNAITNAKAQDQYHLEIIHDATEQHLTLTSSYSQNNSLPLVSSPDKKKVLIVEDNEDIINYLADYLSRHHQVFTANNGNDGYEKAAVIQPDIIVSDVMMPGMYGTDLCSRLKSAIETCHIPIILLTARTSTQHKIQGFEIGADDYLTKPFDQKLLLARINNLIITREKLKDVYGKSIKINPKEITTNSKDKEFLEKAISLVEDNLDNAAFSLDVLADNMNMSRSTFYRKIKALTNEAGDDFVRSIRLKKAAHLLTQHFSITEIAYTVGFSDPKYFSKSFKQYYGCIPSEFVKQHTNTLNV
jgi:signal transduction histidine kinase/DNA-binding response OmpR family regulator